MYSHLLGSLTEQILGQVILLVTACDVWVTLDTMYSSHSRAGIMQTRMNMATFRKGNLSILGYNNRMKMSADNLAVAGSPMGDDEAIKEKSAVEVDIRCHRHLSSVSQRLRLYHRRPPT